jgi:hypothetical protein
VGTEGRRGFLPIFQCPRSSCIPAISWRDGSAEFSGPHVYCHFDFDREPYEEVTLYRQYSDGAAWMPMDASIRYRPHTYPVWNRRWLHRKITKHQRRAET